MSNKEITFAAYSFTKNRKKMKNVIDLAKKIDSANKTLATQTELVKLVGRHESPESLAIAAARLILSNKASLTFIK